MDKCIYDRKKEESVEKWRMIQNLVLESYDRIAVAYARQYGNELLHKPFDRELLHRFATEVKDRGDVCDVGCGPGHIARYLRDMGLAKVFGLDLSPAMVEQARKLNADLSSKVGNVMALDLVDASLGGIIAFYAIVNIPPNLLPTVFREMCRVLKPGGRLLLTFHIGDEIVQPRNLWGNLLRCNSFSFSQRQSRNSLKQPGSQLRTLSSADHTLQR